MKKILLLFIITFLFALGSFAATLSFKFDGSGFISDGADVINEDDADEIAYYLNYVNQKKNYTILVITVNSLEGVPPGKIAGNVAEYSNISNKDNLMVFLVSPSEAKIGIDMGENVKNVLPYEKLSEIINNKIAPSFRTGNYSAALKGGIFSILQELEPSVVEFSYTSQARYVPFVNTASSNQLLSDMITMVMIYIIGSYALYALVARSTRRTRRLASRYRRCGFGRILGKNQLLFEQEFLEKR